MEDRQATSRETVRILAALSDENRFRILSLLASEGEELSCGAISKALELSPSLLSHHLAILADAGLIGRRRNGIRTMNALERAVIERQLEALDVLFRCNGHTAANGDAAHVPARATAPAPTTELVPATSDPAPDREVPGTS